MYKRFSIIALILSISFLAYSQVDDSQSKAIVKETSEKIQSYENIKIDFTYKMTNKEQGIDESMEGSILISGDKVNLKVMGQTIISDGETIWVYNEDFNEVQIMDASEGGEAFSFFDMIVNFDDSFKTQLIKTITENGKSYHIIDLRPKSGKSYFKIRLKIDKKSKMIAEGIIYNKDGNIFTYVVNSWKANVVTKTSDFVFDEKDYPDADITDFRE